MYTADECRARARANLEEAKHDKQRRKSLTNAAEAWLLLALRVDHAFIGKDNRPSQATSTGGLVRIGAVLKWNKRTSHDLT